MAVCTGLYHFTSHKSFVFYSLFHLGLSSFSSCVYLSNQPSAGSFVNAFLQIIPALEHVLTHADTIHVVMSTHPFSSSSKIWPLCHLIIWPFAQSSIDFATSTSPSQQTLVEIIDYHPEDFPLRKFNTVVVHYVLNGTASLCLYHFLVKYT